MTTEEQALQALQQVMDPELNRSIVDLGMVHDMQVENGIASFTLALTTMACPLRNRMQEDARQALMALEGIDEVSINLREMTSEEREKALGGRDRPTGSAEAYNNIDHVVAVLSGKGGVGKSSVAALLAITLSRKGHSVGLLDADITGPSIPKMLLDSHEHPMTGPMGIRPVETDTGIKVMSINLLLEDPNQAVIWRGPMISGAIQQFWGDVAWGKLDYLIVDLPPGTSDASLTVMQSMPLNGIILVTTPQSLAGMVVRKSAAMATQLDIPILGLVENMSYVHCPECGHDLELFGPSKAYEVAQALGAPVLGRIPIDPDIALYSDAGRLEEYESEEFEQIADRLMALIPERAFGPAAG